MPDNGRRAEGDHATALLKAPAEVHVIACLAVFGVKAADLVERPAVEGHVTAGNVLGDDIGEQDMARASGCRCYAGLDPIFRRRRNVWPAHPGEVAAK